MLRGRLHRSSGWSVMAVTDELVANPLRYASAGPREVEKPV
jgi:hypothetical protein